MSSIVAHMITRQYYYSTVELAVKRGNYGAREG